MSRKPPKTAVWAFKVEEELAEFLNKLPNKSAFIRKAIATQLGMACPLCNGKGVVPRGVQPFHLRDKPVRGRLVRLGPLADALLTRHHNDPNVTALAGQALALTAGLAAALKFRGSFSLQAKGDGPVTMLLADCSDSGALRGYARADAERLAPLLADAAAPNAAQMLGQGYLAFTCDQGPEMDRYQGLVAIEGETLTDMTGTYFRTSEQLATHVHLACARTEAGWRAAALIIERVAGAGGGGEDLDQDAQDDAWRTALALAATLTDAELLDDGLPGERLPHLSAVAEVDDLGVDTGESVRVTVRRRGP